MEHTFCTGWVLYAHIARMNPVIDPDLLHIYRSVSHDLDGPLEETVEAREARYKPIQS